MFISGLLELHNVFRFFKGSLTIILVKISSMNSNVKIIFKNTGGLLQYLKIVETCVS